MAASQSETEPFLSTTGGRAIVQVSVNALLYLVCSAGYVMVTASGMDPAMKSAVSDVLEGAIVFGVLGNLILLYCWTLVPAFNS
jgi:hypothetical protein